MSSNSVVTDGALYPASLSARVQLLLWQHHYGMVFFWYKGDHRNLHQIFSRKINRGKNHNHEGVEAAPSFPPLEAANFPLCLPLHQSTHSLQIVCTHSPLQDRKWHLGKHSTFSKMRSHNHQLCI